MFELLESDSVVSAFVHIPEQTTRSVNLQFFFFFFFLKFSVTLSPYDYAVEQKMAQQIHSTAVFFVEEYSLRNISK